MEIGEKIKLERLKKGFSQQELGEKIGVQKSAISKWERGEIKNIKRGYLKKIADILDIPPTELLFDNYDEKYLKTIKKEKAVLNVYLHLNKKNQEKALDYIGKLLVEQVQNNINDLKGGD